MALRFFNTLGRRLEPFVPIEPGKVQMYTCGPTVYDFPHIGNFRTFIFEDLLRRYLRFKGFEVTHVMNLTDVDDKTIRGARREGIRLRQYTDRYVKAFFHDLDILRIERAEHYPRATEHISEMVSLIKNLLAKEHAYTRAGSIYYDISKLSSYGALSGVRSSASSASKIDADEYGKEDARDFALWKAWDPEDGDVFWEVELGKGRPGWHIECSAMSMKYLGESFDIHAGGVDLIFPHHENEIAQSEAATGRRFVTYWLHSEHLLVEGRKMAKSLGNCYTLRDLLEKGYGGRAIRYLLLSAHYREPLNFTFLGLDQAASTVSRLDEFYIRLQEQGGPAEPNPRIGSLIQHFLQRFEESLDDDLNLPSALAALFDFIRETNREMDKRLLSEQDARAGLLALRRIDQVLGLLEEAPAGSLDSEIRRLIELREQARTQRDWATADRIRNQLFERGIVLEDTPSGVRWKLRTGPDKSRVRDCE